MHRWRAAPSPSDSVRMFCQSFRTKEQADQRRDFLQAGRDEHKYTVVPSDIDITKL